MPTIIEGLIVPTDTELLDESNYVANWRTYRLRFVDCPTCKLSRKVQAEFLSVALAYIDHRSIFYSDGRIYCLPEFDTVFKESVDYRAFSDYTKRDESGSSYNQRIRSVEKLRFFWILMSVYDDIHTHIDLSTIHNLLGYAHHKDPHITL